MHDTITSIRRITRRRLGLPACALIAALLATACASPPSAPTYTCCNLRSDGKWISDINYVASDKYVIPAGTPARVTGYGRYRVHLDLAGKSQDLGNDYSRDMDLDRFAQRYIVADDPRLRLATYPDKIQAAIKSARITIGMNEEQVLMALGYPVSSENPHLDTPVWRYWISSFGGFDVRWDEQRRVREVTGRESTLNVVLMP